MTGDQVEPDLDWATQVFVDAVRGARDEENTVALGNAMVALGERYRDGIGIGRSTAHAVRWFVAASRLGKADPQHCRIQLDRLMEALTPAGKVEVLRQVESGLKTEAAPDGGDSRFGPLESCWRQWARSEGEALREA